MSTTIFRNVSYTDHNIGIPRDSILNNYDKFQNSSVVLTFNRNIMQILDVFVPPRYVLCLVEPFPERFKKISWKKERTNELVSFTWHSDTENWERPPNSFLGDFTLISEVITCVEVTKVWRTHAGGLSIGLISLQNSSQERLWSSGIDIFAADQSHFPSGYLKSIQCLTRQQLVATDIGEKPVLRRSGWFFSGTKSDIHWLTFDGDKRSSSSAT